jgi:hypothetical protein
MNCSTTQELFSDYADGGLRPEERKLLEEHLSSCAPCSREFRYFTESLRALREMPALETTRFFLPNVKAAAAAHLRETAALRSEEDTASVTVVTPRAEPPPPRRRRLAYVPVAAGVLASFALGLAFGGRGRTRELENRLRALEAARTRPAEPDRPAAPEPPRFPDPEAVLAEHGLVRVDGRWIPQAYQEAFEKGRVVIGGKVLAREEAARLLAAERPPEPPPPPERPEGPAPAPSADEILARAGYRKVNDVYVPEAWLGRWGEGLVQVGVNEWKKPSEFKEELIREHNLVEVRGKLMTREQAEALQSQQLVRMPDAATAVNEVTRALEGLQIGPPMHYRGITVYPLLRADPPGALPAVPLHAAVASGRLELVDDRLFGLQARNDLESDVLFLAGDVVAGGRCARVVTEDTLVPRGQTGRVPVFCAEPGAWRAADRFARESGHYVAPPCVRRALVREQGQGALWALLARRLDRGRAGLVDLFRKHAEALADIRAYFTVLPEREPTAVGAAVALGHSLEFAEVFHDAALFAACFDRLILGAALDVLERPADPPLRTAPAPPNSVPGVKQFLEGAFFWTYEAREEGYAIRRDEAWVGRARLAPDGLAHAVLFAPSPAAEPDRRAAYSVPKEKIARALAEFETRLKALGPVRRASALRELASISAPEVTAALVRHLNEPDPLVRRAVVQELGAGGDPRATEPLLQLLALSRGDLPLFAETVRALARLGDERAVDPLLQQIDAGPAENARLIVQNLPELLLQVRSREPLARAVGRLIVLYEAAEGVLRGEAFPDPAARNARPAEAQALAEAARAALGQVAGVDFGTAGSARKWWNDRDSRERFLKERTSR